MNQFIILLASNSEAKKNMTDARNCLSMFFSEGIRFSENHWSAAVVKEGTVAPQGENSMYLNAVCVAQSERSLDDVQGLLKQFETEMGRIRGVDAQGQVAIDLDLVEWNGEVLRPKDASQDYYKVCLSDFCQICQPDDPSRQI